MRGAKQKPILENLLITDIAAEGKAIARLDGMVVFVSECVPGDIVDVQVIRKRKRFMEGYPVKFHAYSEKRTEYRNKLEFTFSNNRWLTNQEIQSGHHNIERRALGFHIPGKFDKVLD